jgi:DNA-3-methyladenine glycosylase
MAARLPRAFYARASVEVAPALLGQVLVRLMPDGSRLAARIVETEAYEPGDPASHAFRGPTPRNRVMFEDPGHLYVYFTYGHHWMLNAVTRRRGEGSAVLLRAAEPLEGVGSMARFRGRTAPIDLCSGPGKLAQALGADRSLDGEDLVRGTKAWIERGAAVPPADVATGIRVGVNVGFDRPWRYWDARSAFVSRGRPGPTTRRASRR